MIEKASQLFSGENRSRNMIIAGCGVLLVFICFCLVVGGVVVGLDPFNLNLIARLTGRYNPVLEVMPVNTGVYASLNVLQLTGENTLRIVRAFEQDSGETPGQETETLLQGLDDQLMDELGVTLTGDIMPWVGERAGIGINNIQLNKFGEPEQVDFLIAIEIQDMEAFALFQDKFKQGIENKVGEQFMQEEYQGTVIWSMVTARESYQVAMAEFNSLFLISQTAQPIKDALDTKRGTSLADSEVYSDMIAQLPEGRVLTLFIDGAFLVNFIDNLPGAGLNPTQFNSLTSWKGMSASLGVVDAGVQVDAIYAFDATQLTDIQRQALDSLILESQIQERLPEGTLGVISGQGLNTVWSNMEAQMMAIPEGADFQESVDLLENMLGIDLDTDLFALLDGEYGLAIVPSTNGIIAQEGPDLGVIFLAETSNPNAMNKTLEKLVPFIEDNIGISPEPAEVNGQTVYILGDPSAGLEALVYGVVENHLNIASSTSVIQNTFSGGSALASADRYQNVWRAFPSGSHPIIYVDLEGLFNVIREGLGTENQTDFNKFSQVAESIQFFAAGGQLLQEGMMRTTLIAFIETTE